MDGHPRQNPAYRPATPKPRSARLRHLRRGVRGGTLGSPTLRIRLAGLLHEAPLRRGFAVKGKMRHADRQARRARHAREPGLPRQSRGARAGSVRRPHGSPDLHRVLPPPAHRPRADRRRALLPRPAARRHRRARDDADQRRGPDDARCRPCVAPGRGRGGDPRRRPSRPRHLGGMRAIARGGTGEGRCGG